MKGRKSLKTFYNEVLGLPYSEKEARTPDPDDIQKAMTSDPVYPEGQIPDQVAFLTMGVDIQHGWIAISVIGWSERMESYIIHRSNAECDVTADPKAVAREIQKVLHTRFKYSDNRRGLTAALCCVDVGDRQTAVLAMIQASFPRVSDWSRGYRAIPHGTVVGVKGSSKPEPERIVMGAPGGKTAAGRRQSRRFFINGVSALKYELYMALNLMVKDTEGANSEIYARCHAPHDFPDEFYKELTAEEIVVELNRDHRMVRKFKLKNQMLSNEQLDLHCLCRFGAEVLGSAVWEEREWEFMRKKASKDPEKDLPKGRQEYIQRRRDKIADRRKNRRSGKNKG